MKYTSKLIAQFFLVLFAVSANLILPVQAKSLASGKVDLSLRGKGSYSSKDRFKSTKKDQIPDLVAYELLFRVISEGNAREVLKNANLTPVEVESLYNEAKSINESLQAIDKQVRALKNDKSKSVFNATEQLNNFEDLKIGIVLQSKESLQNSLNESGWISFQTFVKNEIKSKIKIISSTSFDDLRSGKRNLYVYSTSWNDGKNVFGSGALYTDYNDLSSYSVVVSITSPRGRFNSTRSDWSETSLASSTGLSVGIEDGAYTVQTTVESQKGDFDDYGNFQGEGKSSKIDETILIESLAPVVNAESVNSLTLNNSTSGNSTGTLTVTISSTTDVPPNTTGVVELYETSTPQFAYTVNPTDRRQTFTIATPGQTTTASFTVSIQTTTSTGSGTNVTNKARILSLTPAGSATIGSNQPTATITYQYQAPPGGNGGTGGMPACYWTNTCSPILLDIEGDGFAMTDYYQGVPFDVAADGVTRQTSWTAADSDDAWLVLDRNGNGKIDSTLEMFGNLSEQPAGQNPRNGFSSLSLFDRQSRGGNNDGKITRNDTVFSRLRLWQDRNHNGISEPEELSRLPDLDVVALFLDYQSMNYTDQYGNRFLFRARVRDARGARVGRWAWDVFFVTNPSALNLYGADFPFALQSK